MLKDKQSAELQIQPPEKYLPGGSFSVWVLECRQYLMDFASNRQTCLLDTLISREVLKEPRLSSIRILPTKEINDSLTEMRPVFGPLRHPDSLREVSSCSVK